MSDKKTSGMDDIEVHEIEHESLREDVENLKERLEAQESGTVLVHCSKLVGDRIQNLEAQAEKAEEAYEHLLKQLRRQEQANRQKEWMLENLNKYGALACVVDPPCGDCIRCQARKLISKPKGESDAEV